ncbi:MAG: molecular chaperone HtpG, partial [Candidatus Aminicenantaceae bacterium]
FYSSFMVASEIHICTKSFKKGSKAYLWKSKGESAYSIEETVKKVRGTRIELFLKKDEKEFLEKHRIKNILLTYSKFIPFPIYFENEKVETAEAIWTQPKSSLKKKDYIDFYKFFENTQEEPETYLHLSSDAPVQFNSILFIPKTSIENIGLFKTEPGVDLYSRKVLIQKASKEIFPEYLRFIKGVIDSEDMPLNISRETIQNNVKINKIKKHIMGKLFSHLEKIKNKDRNQYIRIWNNFNKNFKEGIAVDFENREKLSNLLLFPSSKKQKDEYTDLKEYTERMPKSQNEIYYLTGIDYESIEKNPALEAFKKKDTEVLYLIDPLDEIVLDNLREYEGKRIKSVESADIKLDEARKEEKEDIQDVQKFVDYLKSLYGDKIQDVRISNRLVDSPCILVQPSAGPSAQVEKIMKIVNKEYQYTRKVFEINPNNKLIKEMVRIHKKNPNSKILKSLALQLLDNHMLREGIIEDIDHIVPRIQDIMLQAAKKQ